MAASLSPFTLTIFGASGDLAKRKLFSAIYNLYRQKLIGEDFGFIGYARTEITREAFVEFFRKSLADYCPEFKQDGGAFEKLRDKITYVQGAYDAPDGFQRLAAAVGEFEKRFKCSGNRVFHLATPPSVFEPISQQLSLCGLGSSSDTGLHSRIIIEKPFGHDLKSARELNRKLNQAFLEKQIYRIDHYLGKETVQNILTLRFSNILLESVWNNRYIDHVQISVCETLGIEQRGSYYDGLGCTRDMVQNHLMQLLCITAVEPPNNIDSDEVRDEKVKVLKALRPFDLGNLSRCAVRGQYGPSKDGKLKGYHQEEGVAPDSPTETVAACKLYIDNWRCVGTPFYIRTGKRMSKRYSEIFLQFKDIPKKIFGEVEGLRPDGILVRIQPNEGVSLYMKAKVPGASTRLQSVSQDFNYATSFEQRSADAYERLLYDAILEKPALFIRADETELSWAFYEPLLDYWRDNKPKDFPNYFAATDGPTAAEDLLQRDGRAWHQPRV